MRVDLRLHRTSRIIGKQKLEVPRSAKQSVIRSNMALKASNNSSIKDYIKQK